MVKRNLQLQEESYKMMYGKKIQKNSTDINKENMNPIKINNANDNVNNLKADKLLEKGKNNA